MSGVARWQADLVIDAHAQLGEGPVWSQAEQLLYWVDIEGRMVHRYDPSSGSDDHVDVGERVGSVAPRAAGGLVLALASGFATLDAWGAPPRRLVPVEADRPDLRMNDGACDSCGRFWAGTMALDFGPRQGALYRLDPDGRVERMLGDVTISNGIAWSPDDSLMYYVDTRSCGIDVFDFEAGSGTIASRRRLVDVDEADGEPDGLVVDEEGCLWLALWGGSCVRRYAPDGRLVGIVEVPVPRVTKCAFGGPDLDDLYITTALEDDGNAPHAGGVFGVRPGVRGLPAHAFAG